jgi:hypothetical protein
VASAPEPVGEQPANVRGVQKWGGGRHSTIRS